jgi:hypothetical protein
MSVGHLVSAIDAAAKLGVTPERLRALCRQRRVKGARNIVGRWFVPEEFVVTPGKRGPRMGK